jgi:hypothetical protein
LLHGKSVVPNACSSLMICVESTSQLREILESSFELKENWEIQIGINSIAQGQ